MLFPTLIVLSCLSTISLVIWLGIYFHWARPWDFEPVGDAEAQAPEIGRWPEVRVVVPARNESESLPHTLPDLLTQDYPGSFRVVLVDDRSDDGTAGIAENLARGCNAADRLTVLKGAALPEGWVGKVWALEQAASHCGLSSAERPKTNGQGGKSPPSAEGVAANTQDPAAHAAPSSGVRIPEYLLLTDADIRHAPGSLRRLVAESELGGLALNSRMARLRCASAPERLLIPAFVFFFNLMYPMRAVNDPRRREAAAAGGCVLLSSKALQQAGGFACIRGEIIDDVNLARHIKALDVPIRLSLSATEVESLRRYETLGSIWKMVRRTAFTELDHCWGRLAVAVLGLALLFLLPLVGILSGVVLAAATVAGFLETSLFWCAVLTFKSVLAWALMSSVYRPGAAFFKLRPLWSLTLPLAGLLYGAMTVDSALRHLQGKRTIWR